MATAGGGTGRVFGLVIISFQDTGTGFQVKLQHKIWPGRRCFGSWWPGASIRVWMKEVVLWCFLMNSSEELSYNELRWWGLGRASCRRELPSEEADHWPLFGKAAFERVAQMLAGTPCTSKFRFCFPLSNKQLSQARAIFFTGWWCWLSNGYLSNAVRSMLSWPRATRVRNRLCLEICQT